MSDHLWIFGLCAAEQRNPCFCRYGSRNDSCGIDTEEDAADFREKIVKKLGNKYKIETNNNPDSKITIKEYLVGTSPTNPSEPYITISTYKYNDSGSYVTGIVYGPFEYNDETF